MSFADAEYAGKRKQTRRERFLIEMDQVVPWKGLIALIEPHYPKGEGGRPAYALMAMLRVHLMQNWFGYSDPAMEEALYETTILRQFSGQHLDRIPDETMILNFWVIAQTCPPICIRPDQSFASDLTIMLRVHDRQRTTLCSH